MNSSLFAPSPRRKRGLILTLFGSVLFHGSLIGVAAYWPTPSVEEPRSIVSVGWNTPEPADEPLPPSASPGAADLEPPLVKASEPVDETPPAIEPSVDDMALATPPPRSVLRTPSRPVAASSLTHPIHAQSSLPAGGPISGVAGSSGVGHPGAAGVRWNTSKPAYPAALRLAHVQGSGSVRVTTDGSGRVVSATIVQSTGNALLDDNICRAARSGWSGPPNSAISVPVTYRLP